MIKTKQQRRTSHTVLGMLIEALEKRALLTAPVVSNFNFNYETTHSLTLNVSPNMLPGAPGVTDGLTDSDLILERVGLDINVAEEDIQLAYSGSNPATFSFTGIEGSPNPNGTILTDGNYRGTISLQDLVHSGDPMATDAREDFFVLAGDMTGATAGVRDRQVNLADFNRLASFFGQSGVTYSQGDLNYDGVCNLADFNRLAANFGVVLNAPAVGSGVITVDSLVDGTLRVNWDATTAGNNTQWRIQKSTDGQNFSIYAHVDATVGSFIDDGDGNPNPGGPGLPAGTRFWYRVRAVGGNPETAYTAKRGGTTVEPAPPLITDLTEPVADQEMDDVSVTGSYTIPASTTAGTLTAVGLAAPEDFDFPYVRPTHYNWQANPDGSVSLTFSRAGLYIVKATRQGGGGPSTQFLAVSSEAGWLLPRSLRGVATKIPQPNADIVLISSDTTGGDRALAAARRIMGSLNYEPMDDIDDLIQDVQEAWILNNFQPVSVAIVDHGLPGWLSLGGGVNSIPGEYISYLDPNTAGDLSSLMNFMRGKVDRLDFYNCEAARTGPPDPSPWTDDGDAFLQHIATGIDAPVRGWNKSTGAVHNFVFGGAFYVLKGGVRVTKFP